MIHNLGDYKIICLIGSGVDGCVFMGMHRMIDFPVAIKIINRFSKNGQISNNEDKPVNLIDNTDRIMNEIEIMKKLNHPNIISLIDVVENQNSIALVQELALHGTVLFSQKLSSESAIFKFFSQICDALNYLHNEIGIVHRDIKAENILVDEFGNIKLTDFGLSKSVQKNSMLKTRCGSPLYSSPELIKGQEYDEKTDVWSLGILLFYFSTGKFPFHSNNILQLLSDITTEDVVFPEPCELSLELKNLILKMLEKDPSKRPNIREIMEDPWYLKMKNEIYEPFPMLNKEITANIIDFENIGISGEQYKKLRERDLHQFQVIEKILTLKKKQEIIGFSKRSRVLQKISPKQNCKRLSGDFWRKPLPGCRKLSFDRRVSNNSIFECHSLFKPKILYKYC